jgi:hypothetical protein
VHRDVAVDVVDEGRVEGLLSLEEWGHGLPDERAHPPTPPGLAARTSLEEVPAFVERRDLVFVVRRGGRGHVPQPLDGSVERRKRIIVCTVRIVTFLLQAGKVVDSEGPIEHAKCVIRGRVATLRPTTLSSGLLAAVYIVRGIRPATWPGRHVSAVQGDLNNDSVLAASGHVKAKLLFH